MRRLLWLAVAAIAVVLVVVVWINRRPVPAPLPREAFPLPPLSESPCLNTGADVRYVGIDACKECHLDRYDSYLHTAHSRALSDVDLKAEPPDGKFEHGASGRSYRVYREGNQFRHQEVVRTPGGREIARQDLPVRSLVGSGHFSRTYLAEADGFLSESPITWYTQKQRWDMSPGYDRAKHPGFQRLALLECLYCHAGRVERREAGDLRVNILEQRIGCESCHGPGSRHAEYQRANKHPAGTDDLTIVNPGKLPRSRLEAICAVCHLQGTVWADVRGRKITDFRPGQPLTDYRVHYVFNSKNDRMRVVGHVEQLRQSVCYQKSGELSCLTCHDPHQRQRPKDTTAYYRQKCLSCHASQGCSLATAERLKKNPADDCTACHMPRGDTDIPHIAFTHHRIGRHTSRPAQPDAGDTLELVPHEEAPQLTEIDRRRNLGLAYLLAAFNADSPQRAFACGRMARDILEPVLEAGLRDGPILQSLAQIYRREQLATRARVFAQEALATNDLSAEGRGDLLLMLAEGHLLDKETEEAVAILQKLTRTRRSPEDWRALGTCYLKMNQPDRALAAFEKALTINPFDHRVHTKLAELHRRRGDEVRAREHEEKARLLAQYSKS